MVVMDSDEFKAWHEVGHATVCLHLGGSLDCIEFLEESAQGFAVTRGCYVMPGSGQSVACGGFAAEFYLLRTGQVDGAELNNPEYIAEVSARLFSNAWRDLQEFVGRTVTEDDDFTKQEKEEFMSYAVNRVAPIFDLYFSRMKLVVNELISARRVEGVHVKELLNIGDRR